MRLLHERKRLAALLRVGNRTGRLRKQRRTTPDVDKVLPETTAWYKMYVSNPKLEQDKFHKTFRNRFRLPYKCFKELLEKITDPDHAWSVKFKRWLNINPVNRKRPSPVSLLLLGVLRYMGRGWMFDDIEEATGIDAEVIRCFYHCFLNFGSTHLYSFYVNSPENAAEAQEHMKEMEDAGFHGCVGSMDATHVKMDMCCHGLQTANLGYKMPFAARTYNITVNHRRKILSSTCGHPSRWNDKCLVRFDEFATKLRNGEIMDDNFFNLYKYDDDGNAVSVRYRGAWIMVDGGYLQWSSTVPPFKDSNNAHEIRWSKWLESMRKDVECTFGILKGRWRVLKSGVRTHGTESCDRVWLTCCALHNWLLESDGLDQPWDNSYNAVSSSWTGNSGEFHDHDVPLAVRNLNQSIGQLHRTFDTSGMGRGNDAPLMGNSGYAEEDSDDCYDANDMVEEDGTFIVRKMGLKTFQSCLVEHFRILFESNLIKWPSRNADRNTALLNLN
jgi:hypothetical protein